MKSKKNVVLGKKSHFSREIAENPTLRVGVEWVSKVKNTHVKPQKSLKSHPTRGSFQHPLCSDPRVGLSLVAMVGTCTAVVMIFFNFGNNCSDGFNYFGQLSPDVSQPNLDRHVYPSVMAVSGNDGQGSSEFKVIHKSPEAPVLSTLDD